MEASEVRHRARQGIQSLPDLVRLLYGLVRDPRVPRRLKLLLGGAAAYLVLPVDLLPDWVPGLGRADDLLVLVLALDGLLNHVDEEVVEEHWEGDDEVLVKVREALTFASSFVPDRLKERLLESGPPD